MLWQTSAVSRPIEERMVGDSVAKSGFHDPFQAQSWFACDCVPAAQSKSDKSLRRVCSLKGT